jgi:Glycosyltransferase
MRIVHVEDFFFPKAGYQINLLTRIQAEAGHEVIIVTSETQKLPSNYLVFFGSADTESADREFSERTGVRVCRMPLLGFYSGRAIYRRSIFRFIDSLRPDALYVHGVDTLIGMQFILRSSRLRYPLIMDSHMVELASVNPQSNKFRKMYRRFITPHILRNGIPIIRVADVDYLEKCLGIPLSRTKYLSLGTDVDYMKPDKQARKKLRAEYGIADEAFLVLYAGKLDLGKGGQMLADAIKDELRLTNGREIVFLIIGNTEGEYGARVESTMAESKNRVIRVPTQDYSEIGKFYKAADLAVYPKQCSLSFFDVQACEVPVVLEDNHLNRLRISSGTGFAFHPGDIEDFRRGILACGEMGQHEMEAMGRKARASIEENFNFQKIALEITGLVAEEVDRRRATR